MTLHARGGGWRVWSTKWWDRLSDPACPEVEFRKAFRMSRPTFDALCEEISAAVSKEDTLQVHAAIPVHQRVAVCLWHLATGEPDREVSSRFGIRISTCHNIVLQVCAALTTVLLPKAVRWPLDFPVVASRFQALSSIPGIVGAVCTGHIPIRPPKENASQYYNRHLSKRNNKASYSVAVQAVVDANGTFMDLSIGLPGSLSDAGVLERTALHGHCVAGLLGNDQYRLVGGATYPLKDWMLVPYTHQNLTWTQHSFNVRIEDLHTMAQGAFQILKARWRCLQRRTQHREPDLHNMIGACCVLHNLCVRSGDELDDDLQSEPSVQGDELEAAKSARDRLANGLLHANNASFFF
jgi:hypothetical protein